MGLVAGSIGSEKILSYNSPLKRGKAAPISESARAYSSWTNMKQRCYNPRNPQYKDYGDRGIGVCPEWKSSFSAFLHDMGERPVGLTLERINVDKGYCPENCCWATYFDQNNNQRRTIYINVDGEKTPLAIAAKRFGINYHTMHGRLRTYGIDPCASSETLRKEGARRGSVLSWSKLDEDAVRFIRQSRLPATILAAKFSVNASSILKVRNRKSWTHIP